jgi:hypothetical protein
VNKVELKATITPQGDIRFEPPEYWRNHFKKYAAKEVVVSVEEYISKRSLAQLRYYWGCAVICVVNHHKETTGEVISKDKVHLFNKSVVWGKEPKVVTVMGKVLIDFQDVSLADMPKKEFEVKMEALRKFYAEIGCIIPLPSKDNLLTDFYP